MQTRTHVTFQADFAKDVQPGAPAGRDLARYLAMEVDAAGFATGEPQPHEGYAYRFDCRRAKHRLVVFVALVDDGVQEWLVYAEPEVGRVAGWLHKIGIAQARNTDPTPLRELCMAIHRCLQDNQRFRSIRWYTAEGWDTDPDAGWTRAP